MFSLLPSFLLVAIRKLYLTVKSHFIFGRSTDHPGVISRLPLAMVTDRLRKDEVRNSLMADNSLPPYVDPTERIKKRMNELIERDINPVELAEAIKATRVKYGLSVENDANSVPAVSGDKERTKNVKRGDASR